VTALRYERLLFGIVTLALLGAATTAAAEDRRGPYLGVGLAWGFAAFETKSLARHPSGSSAPRAVRVHDAPGGDLRAGFRFSDRLSGDLRLQYFDGYRIEEVATPTRAAADAIGARLRTYHGFIGAVVHPWSYRLQPYGALGIGAVYVDSMRRSAVPASAAVTARARRDDALAVATRLGGGIDFELIPRVVLNLDIGWLLTANVDVRTLPAKFQADQVPVTLGLLYRLPS